MGSRLFLSAAALLVAFALPVESRAESNSTRHHVRAHHGVRHHHGYFRYGPPVIGGYRNFYGPGYWGETLYDQLPPSAWSDTKCAPGFYNCQSFWERVETQRNYPVQY